jgi:hypothetical protein
MVFPFFQECQQNSIFLLSICMLENSVPEMPK